MKYNNWLDAGWLVLSVVELGRRGRKEGPRGEGGLGIGCFKSVPSS